MFDNVINAMPDMIGKGFPLTKLMHGVGKSSDSLHLDPGELLLTGTLIHLSDQEVTEGKGMLRLQSPFNAKTGDHSDQNDMMILHILQRICR